MKGKRVFSLFHPSSQLIQSINPTKQIAQKYHTWPPTTTAKSEHHLFFNTFYRNQAVICFLRETGLCVFCFYHCVSFILAKLAAEFAVTKAPLAKLAAEFAVTKAP